VYVDKVEATGFIRMDTWVGRRMDVHCTSVGKALVAFRPEAEVEALLRKRGMARHTPRTITSSGRLLRELEEVRAHGYAVDDEENSLGVRCLAAPVFDAGGAVAAALGVTGTTAQVSRAAQARIAEQVQEAARKLSRRLGYDPPPAQRRRR
ncbi:MAG: IclR family transcriptional regulator, partial [Candidatus Acidiferrales bacterium]